MSAKKRRWWPAVKALLCLAILLAIGWRFAKDLSRPELYEQPLAFGWLVLAGLLYLGGLGLSGLYWQRLLVHLGQPATAGSSLRAYFVSQVGKYLPGKAWAVVLRVGLVRGQGVGAGTGALTTFYEVLTTMASGALVGAVLFLLTGPAHPETDILAFLRGLFELPWPDEIGLGGRDLALLCLGLLAVTLGPVLPPVFNRIVGRLSIPFRSGPAPAIRWSWLLEGLAMITPTWILFGLALVCTLQAIPRLNVSWDPVSVARITAVMAMAYVAGFVVVITPGGLGIREFLLTGLLLPEFAPAAEDRATTRGLVVLAVLLLRLVWTASEVLLAGLLHLLPAPTLNPSAPAPEPVVGVER